MPMCRYRITDMLRRAYWRLEMPTALAAEAGRHATELVAERLHGIDIKRWLLGNAAG